MRLREGGPILSGFYRGAVRIAEGRDLGRRVTFVIPVPGQALARHFVSVCRDSPSGQSAPHSTERHHDPDRESSSTRRVGSCIASGDEAGLGTAAPYQHQGIVETKGIGPVTEMLAQSYRAEATGWSVAQAGRRLVRSKRPRTACQAPNPISILCSSRVSDCAGGVLPLPRGCAPEWGL